MYFLSNATNIAELLGCGKIYKLPIPSRIYFLSRSSDIGRWFTAVFLAYHITLLHTS